MTDRRLDWAAIRPLNGGRDKGFEELCAQLARAVAPSSSHFVRKGTPDAGVECYAILTDNTEWGWQSKYFDVLGDSQWSQIDESVATALDKHPQLVQYFICIPLDLSDGRLEGKKSMKMRWDERVVKWKKWASDRGMNVKFTYWGSHEMLDRLAQPQHVGRVSFWFDVRGFDGAWFSARLDESLRTAGPRYTPEIHVNLPIAREFDAFGRTEQFFDGVKTYARKIREKFRIVGHFNTSTVGDAVLDAATTSLQTKVAAILTALADVRSHPTDLLPFSEIENQILAAETAIGHVTQILSEHEQKDEIKTASKTGNTSRQLPRDTTLRDQRIRLQHLSTELETTRENLIHGTHIASSRLLLIRGPAGTGKTHLLCDIARHRITAGQPTVLLMGQRFVSSDVPWSQTLQQLDLPGLSAQEFVGALEAAAQAAGCRALLLIDALNEGAGRTLWPNHLAAFLAQLQRSQWIGVVLSVRSSYEETVIPEEVRAHACTVTHEGFAEHEYDATRTFFIHYGLELPSTPLLAPEFRNPLFLKTLCRGLNINGERRLPRGLRGITAVFNLHLSAINSRLSTTLGFNPKKALVSQALEAFSKACIDSGEQWLPLSKAEELVNKLLTGRDFEKSLYRGLVVEGVLTEEAAQKNETNREEIVFIAYERLADHLKVKTLLDRHLDVQNPASAFSEGAPLSFLTDNRQYVPSGLLEAICIQIPERTGQEVVTLVPMFEERWDIGDAFRQSLIWREPSAFSDDTLQCLNKFQRHDHDIRDTISVLLTVSTLPGHPMNAVFLDRHLRKDTMPERDSWWSLRLHKALGSHGPVDRLVDWASSVKQSTAIDNETVDLCAISLAWMFTASDRLLRDRATKALVNLLTGRMESVGRLVDRFSDTDDYYVVERVYATAYGAAMRCHNPIEVGTLAERVYARVFAAGAPPPHILLRDYARGIIERALYIGSKLQVNTSQIQPPYRSEWPSIPTEEEIKSLLPNWSQVSGEPHEWARNRIGSSVMDGDFARYVIGTNSSSKSRDWLSLRLNEPTWVSPEKEQQALVAEFSDEAKKAWEEFDRIDSEQRRATTEAAAAWFLHRIKTTDNKVEDSRIDALEQEFKNAFNPELTALATKRNQALDLLNATLTTEQTERLAKLSVASNEGNKAHRPPRFELRQIQRYILWRVFDLGWTTERFGDFDRFSVGYDGRGASKTERIGKKYQWIAYHEIMALLSDHFQYREQFREDDGDQAYIGPWQDRLRDIDPSCTLRALLGGTSWRGSAPSWWGAPFDKWGTPEDPRGWIVRNDDIPAIVDLLSVTNPEDKSQWINVQGDFMWRQKPPSDKESTDVEHRELSLLCTGYLIREEEALSFLKWAEGVDFSGHGMPAPPETTRVFLGEHGWASASQYFRKPYFGDSGWIQPDFGCPVKIRTATFDYIKESNGLDCSVDETYRLHLPTAELVARMGLRWVGNSADFVNEEGKIAAFDPSINADGPSALLLRKDILQKFLARERLTICWAVVGEKRVLAPGIEHSHQHPELRLSGAYMLGDKGLSGFLKCILDNPKAKKSEVKPVTILRVGF